MALINGGGGGTDWDTVTSEIVISLSSEWRIPDFVDALIRAAYPSSLFPNLTIEEQEERRKLILRFIEETPITPTVGFVDWVNSFRAGLVGLIKLAGVWGLIVSPIAIFGFPEETGEFLYRTVSNVGVGFIKGAARGATSRAGATSPVSQGISNDLTPLLILGGLIILFMAWKR